MQSPAILSEYFCLDKSDFKTKNQSKDENTGSEYLPCHQLGQAFHANISRIEMSGHIPNNIIVTVNFEIPSLWMVNVAKMIIIK